MMARVMTAWYSMLIAQAPFIFSVAQRPQYIAGSRWPQIRINSVRSHAWAYLGISGFKGHSCWSGVVFANANANAKAKAVSLR